MLMFWLLLSIGLAGFGLGAYWDLKTTEFPDWLPYSMILSALLIRAIFSYIEANPWFIINSLIVGGAFLGMGLLMYALRQWGDGDAWLLGALGFLFPDSSGISMTASAYMPFPVAMLFNFFFVAFLYLISYSVILGLKNRGKSRKFIKELKGSAKELGLMVGSFSIVCIGIVYYMHSVFSVSLNSMVLLIAFPLILFSVIVFMRYGKFVEQNMFVKKIPASSIKVGDVLASDKWRGLTEREVKDIKERGGYVWIKEGVRFAPAFIITMLLTLFYGNIMMMFLF